MSYFYSPTSKCFTFNTNRVGLRPNYNMHKSCNVTTKKALYAWNRYFLTNIYKISVVAQFYLRFKFYFLLFGGMVMYDNEFLTKENNI